MKRLFLALLLVGASANASPALDLSNYIVRFPGTVLIHRDLRRQELLKIAPEIRYGFCPSPRNGWPRHGPQRNITEFKQPGQDLALTTMQASAVYLAAEHRNFRRAARRAVLHNLRYWAKHDALSQFKGTLHANHYYNLDRTLLPLIAAYALVREDAAVRDKDRQAIDNWLGAIVMRRGPKRDTDMRKISARNNHSYLRASATMAWGALQGDDALFRKGIETYARSLEQMNVDRALPLELARGPFSLSYHRHAIASLTAIAEMAWAQGYDIYQLRNSRGHSLHDLVDYLAEGLTEPEGQNLFFLKLRGHDRHYMAWFEAYRARFTDRASVRTITNFMSDHGAFAQPLLDDYSGGVTSCLFRRLSA